MSRRNKAWLCLRNWNFIHSLVCIFWEALEKLVLLKTIQNYFLSEQCNNFIQNIFSMNRGLAILHSSFILLADVPIVISILQNCMQGCYQAACLHVIYMIITTSKCNFEKCMLVMSNLCGLEKCWVMHVKI